MLMTQNSVMNLLIGKKIARTVNAQLLDSTNATTYLADGEILITDASGTVLTNLTVVGKDSIRLVQGQGAGKPLIWSDEIFNTGVKQFSAKAYTAGTVQIDYVGYDSVTNAGSIDVISSNDYEIHVFDIDSTTFGTLGNSKYGFYTSDASATQQEIALGLTESLFTNTRDLVFPSILVEMVANNVFVTGLANTCLMTNGSIQVTSTAHALTVGTLVRFITDTDLFAVYSVASVISANVFTLNYPYQGPSGAAVNGFQPNAAPTAFGVRITGKVPYYLAPNLTNYHVNRWKTTVMNSGATTVTTEQNATEGSGEYPQIAVLEYFLLGNEGLAARQGVIPQIAIRANVEATGTYDIVSLYHYRQQGGSVQSKPAEYKQLIIAVNMLAGQGGQFTDATTGLKAVLNAWITTLPDITI